MITKLHISKSIYSCILLSVFLFACVREPEAPLKPENSGNLNGIYVICEGLWHFDNSTVSKIDIISGSVITNYFEYVNNYKIGDLANGGVVYGECLYVVLTTPAIIEKIDLKTGRSIARLKMKANSDPRKIYILDDTTAYVTNLKKYSISVINPENMSDKGIEIPVGPAPEFICGDGKNVYAANSGYGDYLADKPGAGSISVIDTKTNHEIKKVFCGPNLIEVKYNAKLNRLYACYYHLPSMSDSLGGIVEYSLPDMKEIHRIRIRANALTISEDGYDLYYNTDEGLYRIDLLENKFITKLIIKNSNKSEKWYSIAQYDDNLYIANAKNFQMNGEMMAYRLSNFTSPFAKYSVGINPNTILKVNLTK